MSFPAGTPSTVEKCKYYYINVEITAKDRDTCGHSFIVRATLFSQNSGIIFRINSAKIRIYSNCPYRDTFLVFFSLKFALSSSFEDIMLSLVLKTEDLNLGLLKPLFPNVSVLNLTLTTHLPRWWALRQEWTYALVTAVCGN